MAELGVLKCRGLEAVGTAWGREKGTGSGKCSGVALCDCGVSMAGMTPAALLHACVCLCSLLGVGRTRGHSCACWKLWASQVMVPQTLKVNNSPRKPTLNTRFSLEEALEMICLQECL